MICSEIEYMDYQKIYSDLIRRAKLRKLVIGMIYEKHHIIPMCFFKTTERSFQKGHLLGNPDHPNNLVELTLREHYIAHLLLARIYKDTMYGYKLASCLLLMIENIRKYTTTSNTNSKTYEHGRSIARSAISAKRKGRMPVKCSITGQMIGDVEITHPKVLDGSWVHHSKGKVSVTDKNTNAKLYIDVDKFNSDIHLKNRPNFEGCKNPNYKDLTDDVKNDIFDCVMDCCENEYLNATKFNDKIRYVGYKHFSKPITGAFIKNKFGSIHEFLRLFNLERNKNIKFDRYYRGFSSYKNTGLGKRWYNNGTIERLFYPNNVPDGFIKGKLKL